MKILLPREKMEKFKRYLESREIIYLIHRLAEGVEELEVNNKHNDIIQEYMKELKK
jgi:hypothetical protein